MCLYLLAKFLPNLFWISWEAKFGRVELTWVIEDTSWRTYLFRFWLTALKMTFCCWHSSGGDLVIQPWCKIPLSTSSIIIMWIHLVWNTGSPSNHQKRFTEFPIFRFSVQHKPFFFVLIIQVILELFYWCQISGWKFWNPFLGEYAALFKNNCGIRMRNT